MSRTRWLRSLGAIDALVLTSAIWFLAKFVRYAFPPLFGTFQGEYGVSAATLGLLFSVLMLVYAGMQFPSGALADRVGAVRVIAGGVLVLGAAAFGLAATQSFVALVVAMVLIGLGTGVHKTVAINLLADVYPARTGRALGIMDAIGELGGVAAPAAVVLLLGTALGWPSLFLLIGAASIAIAVAFVRRVPRRLPDRPVHDESPAAHGDTDLRSYLSVLREPGIAGFVVAIVAYSFAFNGLVAFLPLFLEVERGFPRETAGLLYAVLFAVSLIQPLSGDLADRFGRYPLMIGLLGLAGISLAALVLDGPVWLAGGLVALVGIGGHGFRPVRESHLVAVLPADAVGGSLGLIRTVMMGAGAVAPAVVGLLAEATTYGVSFLLLAAVFGIAAVAVVGLAVVEEGYNRG